jgi:hypothetical protein
MRSQQFMQPAAPEIVQLSSRTPSSHNTGFPNAYDRANGRSASATKAADTLAAWRRDLSDREHSVIR